MDDLAVSIPLLRLDPDLEGPTNARPGDAGFDLRARNNAVIAPSGGRVLMPTGFAIALPPGYAALILPRSGLALRQGLSVANAPGLIDSGYRGEIAALLLNTDPEAEIRIERGDRIAQMMIQRVVPTRFAEVDKLDDSERGAAGWGSTGS